MQIATHRAQIATHRAYQIMKNVPVRAETAVAATETTAEQTKTPATAAQQQKQQQEIRKHNHETCPNKSRNGSINNVGEDVKLELLRTNMDKEMAERMHNALRFGLIETDVMATFETLKAWLVKDCHVRRIVGA